MNNTSGGLLKAKAGITPASPWIQFFSERGKDHPQERLGVGQDCFRFFSACFNLSFGLYPAVYWNLPLTKQKILHKLRCRQSVGSSLPARDSPHWRVLNTVDVIFREGSQTLCCSVKCIVEPAPVAGTWIPLWTPAFEQERSLHSMFLFKYEQRTEQESVNRKHCLLHHAAHTLSVSF